jgi:hypothetical protein
MHAGSRPPQHLILEMQIQALKNIGCGMELQIDRQDLRPCGIASMQYSLIQTAFNVEAYTGKKSCEKYSRYFKICFPGVALPSKSSISARWRSFAPHSLTYVTYILYNVHHIRKCKDL